MGLKKISIIFLFFFMLFSVYPLTAAAVSNQELPWNWIQISSKGHDLYWGLGTRDPNLGDNIGLQVAAAYSNNKISPGLDLLYFFDPSDNYSVNIGIGVFADNSAATTKYSTTYSGGFWYYFDNFLAGIGYHSQQGLTLRGVLKF